MRYEEKFKKNIKIIIGIGFLLIGILFLFLGILIGDYLQSKKFRNYANSIKNIRESSTENKFISPLIGSVSDPSTDIGIYIDIKERVSTYLNTEEKNGELSDFSFYFKDINTPFWFGVNEQANFVPASLYKLPIAIAVYKQSEIERNDFLKKTIVYSEDIDSINRKISGNDETRLIVGNAYSVEDLTKIMLKESDNGAKNLLVSVLDKKYIVDLFSLLDIALQNDQGYIISSRNYAHFLRVLYNASYLDVDHSEYLLSLLVSSDFKDGLVAGVPRNVQVAHKYGTYTIEEGGVTYSVLHDCGIVYHTENPYILCFMTKGKNIKYLFSIISNVSKMVYEEQDSGNR